MMSPAAQTKAYREEVVTTSPTIKPTISAQDIFPAAKQFYPLHGTDLCDMRCNWNLLFSVFMSANVDFNDFKIFEYKI